MRLPTAAAALAQSPNQVKHIILLADGALLKPMLGTGTLGTLVSAGTLPLLSLAIGREGQNARLAAKLTGWRIDIKSEEEKRREVEAEMARMARIVDELKSLERYGISDKIAQRLVDAGVAGLAGRAAAGGAWPSAIRSTPDSRIPRAWPPCGTWRSRSAATASRRRRTTVRISAR